MDLAIKALSRISKGYATILWGRVVIRIGDRFSVGQTASIRRATLTLEEAAAELCKPVS